MSIFAAKGGLPPSLKPKKIRLHHMIVTFFIICRLRKQTMSLPQPKFYINGVLKVESG